MIKLQFYSNLKALRKSKKWTQEEMHVQLNIPRSTWANYEGGISEPDLQTLVRIAKVFDVFVDDLLLTDLSKSLEHAKKLKEYDVEDEAEALLSDDDEENLSTWVVLQQLRRMEGKIDQLLDKDEE